ncbi:MAG: hypothetical protein R2834_05330 [Rhodothermales bacterium]
MTIVFLKGRDKRHTLSCIRDDGSKTWTSIQNVFGPLHDIGHYAVESVLGFDGGFYGLLAQGRSIQEFEETADRSWIGPQGLQSEAVVMALQYELAGVLPYADFLEAVRASCAGTGVPMPAGLNPAIHEVILSRYRALLDDWEAVAPGETLTLQFP